MEHIKEYYDYYLETGSINKVSKEFKKCSKSLKKWFLDAGFEYPRKNFNRKYKFNDSYFKKINTENKAYILGFIYADGCLSYRDRYNKGSEFSLSFNIKYDDLEILEFIKSELKSTHKISKSKPTKFIAPNGKTYVRASQAKYSISSQKLGKDLLQYISTRKTYSLTLPDIDNKFMPHFLRGFFDGDGSISTTKRPSCSFTIKDEAFAKSLFEYFQENNLLFRLYYSKDRDIYTIKSGWKNQIVKFYDFIYKDADFKLNRKYAKFGPLLE